MTPYLSQLVEHLDGLPARVSDQTREKASACVLDALACACGGRDRATTRQATSVAAPSRVGPATVWASGGRRAGVADAVFVNAAAAHALIHEDMHPASRAHCGTVVVPAALAVGEHRHRGMLDVIDAVIVGYEAMARIADVTATPSFVQRGFRPSGVFGPFGAAAATAALLGLTHDQTVNALALAASTASGLCTWAEAGTAEPPLQNAHAARSGVISALLASEGAEGATRAIEGPTGLLHAFADPVTEPPRVRSSEPPAIDEVYFKVYPSCAFTQEAIDVAKKASRDGVDPSSVERVRVRMYSAGIDYPGCDNNRDLATTTARQMSVQFAVAAVLVDGDLRPERQVGALDERIAELAARTELVRDPAADEVYPQQRRVTVELETRDGAVRRHEGGGVVGLSNAQVADKFRAYAGERFDPHTVADTIRAVRSPSTCVDVADLVANLA